MALVVKDRVQEITGTTGTGTVTLGGAVLGYQSFSTVGNGNTTYYTIVDLTAGDWEVGIGTYNSATPSLSRDTVLSSSNAGSLVPFGVGTKNVFVTYPSERSVYLDSPGSYPVQNTFNSLTAATATLTAGTVSTTPSSGTDLANKSYVDTVAAAGIHYHAPVYVESPNTAGNLNAAYNQPGGPGVGVGATLTNAGAKAALTIDGILMTTTKRVLIYNQTNAYENGVYTVTTVGTPDPGGTNWVLTRATDADTYAPSSPNSLGQGDAFFVTNGDTGAGEGYVCTTVGPITFGTTAITFSQFSAAQVYNAGTGLNLSPSTTFNISNTGVSASTYGAASQVPVMAINAQGQVTSATNTAIAIAAGAVSGLAASATTDTTNATNITSGTLPSGRLSGSYTGITGVGTLTAGTWNGSVIGPVYGGTGFGTYAVGDLLYADTTTSLAKLADVAVGNALISGGVGSAPSWGKIGLATHTSGILPIANGGTNTSATATNGGVTYGTGTAYAFTAAGTSGQVLQSNGAAAPTWVNLSTLGVSSFSAGTTGLTPSTATSGAVTLAGTLNVANGGSGATTAQGAMNAFAGAVTSGYYLRGNGTNVVMSAIQAADIPSLSATYLPLAGGTMTGAIVVSSTSVGAQFGNLSVGYGGAYNTLQTKDGTSDLYLQYASTGNINLGTGGGYTTINQSTRSPIFYDSNDTAYYLDPASTSNIYRLNNATWYSYDDPDRNPNSATYYPNASARSFRFAFVNASQAGTGGNYAGMLQYDPWTGTTGSTGDASYQLFFGSTAINGGGYPWLRIRKGIDTTWNTGYNIPLYAANTTYASTLYASVYYDSDDTGYYVDPASTSNINQLNMNGPIVRTVSGQGYLNGNYSSSETIATSGAIYSIGGSYVPGTTTLGNMYGIGYTYTGSGRAVGNPAGTPSDIWGLYGAAAGVANWFLDASNGRGYFASQVNATIFYDANDTAFYVDPAAVGPSAALASSIYLGTQNATDVLWDYGSGGSYRPGMQIRGQYPHIDMVGVVANVSHGPTFRFMGYDNGASGAYKHWVIGTAAQNLTFLDFGFASNDSNPHAGISGYGGTTIIRATTSGNVGIGGDWGAYGTNGNPAYPLHVVGIGYSDTSLRAPIFYDSDNTAYYLDPNSTSQLSYVLADNWFRSQGNTGLYFQSYGYGLWAPEAAGNNYGNVATYNTGRNGWSGYGIGSRHTLMSTGGDNVGIHDSIQSWVYYWDGTSHSLNRGYTIMAGSSRAPIFYDSNNTAYYVDPADVSNLNGLEIGGSSFTVGGGTISITSGSALYFMARAWVNFNGTGTVAIRNSVNVSSITDNGTGDYTVNFSPAMPDANYVVTGTQNGITQNMNPTVTSLLTGSVRFYTSGGAGAGGGVAFYNYDPTQVSIAIFR